MHRIRSLRLRIAFAYIAGTLMVAGFVAGATMYIANQVLTRQSITDARNRSLAQVEFLRDQLFVKGSDVEELERTLQQRGFDVVVKVGNLPSDSTSIGLSEEALPAELRDVVEGGGVGFAIFDGPGYRRIAFGTHIPGIRTPNLPPGFEDASGGEPQVLTYFVYPLEREDRTLSLLLRVLIVVVAVAGAVAGAMGLRLADRTIRPLRMAADAANRVAEGFLDTRLEAHGEDELGRLARTFNNMTEALAERIARERRFVADVSHELRTPLTTLKTSIDFLANRVADLPPRMGSAVGLASEEVKSLQRLVDDLLELSRAEAGGVELVREEIDLVNFANELVRRRAPDSRVVIAGPERLPVSTDKMRLERVVGNLLENAIFHGEGKDVRIELDHDDGHARIAVADQGPGIEPEQLRSIFDRFFRGDVSRRRDGRVGAGLGLAIARENASLLGAELHVSSEKGSGTRFEVVLSAQSEGESAQEGEG